MEAVMNLLETNEDIWNKKIKHAKLEQEILQ